MMSAQELIPVISAIAALIAAAGSLWAALAAHRSAMAARDTAAHAETIDRRGMTRDLITTCHRLVAESMDIAALVEELKSEYRLLATFSGQSGSSREKLLIQKAETKEKEASALKDEAEQLIEQRSRLLHASEEEFTRALSKFDGYLVRILRTKETLEKEIAAAAGDNRIYRERRSVHQRL